MVGPPATSSSDSGLQVSPPSLKTPLTILCGFLGAGKTTVLQHILQNREGLKIGVLVNDVAAINIDSAMVSLESADGLVGLQNGCVCCSDRDGMFIALQRLMNGRNYDHLIVECTGVAEPLSISWEIEDMARRDDPLMQRMFLAGVVCVVDASTFYEMYHSTDSGGRGRRALSVLLVSQIECSSVILVNKLDLISREKLKDVSELVSALNPAALCLTATRGKLPLQNLLPSDMVKLQDTPAYIPSLARRHRIAMDAAHSRHNHRHAHRHDQTLGNNEDCTMCTQEPSYADYGISSFVYTRAEVSFEPGKLAAVARQLPVVTAELGGRRAWPPGAPAPSERFHGVLRSKGFVRVTGDQHAYHWSHAGGRLTLSEAPRAPDGGQELVFIGRGMDESAIRDALDDCLETSTQAKL